MAEPAIAAPRRTGGAAAIVLILIALFTLLWALRARPAKPSQPASVAVTLAKVKVEDVPLTLTELGAAAPWRGVTVRAQAGGRLLRVDAAEGAYVREGQLLAEIDDAPYRATALQAEGAFRRDQAVLEQARLDLKRYQTLLEQNSIARQQVEAQGALVKQDEGVVLLDQGALNAARVNLAWCRIRAPVSGRVGVRLVDPGNIVSPGDAGGILTVNEVTPIAVVFNVPEADFQRLSALSGGFSRPLAVEAFSQETGADLGSGAVAVADNHVDPATGTVAFKARFENAERRLWPSQSVNVRLTLETLRGATTAPAAAVNQGPKGPFAYVVGRDGRATVRPVRPVGTEAGEAVIASGLRPGEEVVIDGQMLLKPGARVEARRSAESTPR